MSCSPDFSDVIYHHQIHCSSNPRAEVNALASIFARYYFAAQCVLLINENGEEMY
jgi:hypothetical protein